MCHQVAPDHPCAASFGTSSCSSGRIRERLVGGPPVTLLPRNSTASRYMKPDGSRSGRGPIESAHAAARGRPADRLQRRRLRLRRAPSIQNAPTDAPPARHRAPDGRRSCMASVPGAERDVPRLVRRDRRVAVRLARGRGQARPDVRRRSTSTIRCGEPSSRSTPRPRSTSSWRSSACRRPGHDLGDDRGVVGVRCRRRMIAHHRGPTLSPAARSRWPLGRDCLAMGSTTVRRTRRAATARRRLAERLGIADLRGARPACRRRPPRATPVPCPRWPTIYLYNKIPRRWFGDLPGSSLTSPSRNARARLGRSIQRLVDDGCDAIVVVAHSGGALVSFETLLDPAHRHLRVEKLVRSDRGSGWRGDSPPIDVHEIARQPALGNLAEVRPDLRWVDVWASFDPGALPDLPSRPPRISVRRGRASGEPPPIPPGDGDPRSSRVA